MWIRDVMLGYSGFKWLRVGSIGSTLNGMCVICTSNDCVYLRDREMAILDLDYQVI